MDMEAAWKAFEADPKANPSKTMYTGIAGTGNRVRDKAKFDLWRASTAKTPLVAAPVPAATPTPAPTPTPLPVVTGTPMTTTGM